MRTMRPGPLIPPAPKGPQPCERCGTPMVEHHCRWTCPNCGAMRDCTDMWEDELPSTNLDKSGSTE